MLIARIAIVAPTRKPMPHSSAMHQRNDGIEIYSAGMYIVAIVTAACSMVTVPLPIWNFASETSVENGGLFPRNTSITCPEYFSKKPWPDLGQPRAPKDVAERASKANTSIGCTGCHLDHFQGDGTVPRLSGQSREYLTKTIADFRTRARGNNPGMSDLMNATSPDDLAALEEYLAGL